MTISCFDLAALRAAPATREPFEFLIVPEFVRAEMRAGVNADFPAISHSGSFPVDQLTYGAAFQDLLDDLESGEFRQAIEEKFDVDLSDRPTTVTVRGYCSAKDGQIHTDSKSKIITILLYMNPQWEASGGRLRLLRSSDNLDDVVAEVPPLEGTLVVFKRSENSWHGHKPFVGARRVVQFHWITSKLAGQIRGHHMSALFKRVTDLVRPKQSRTEQA